MKKQNMDYEVRVEMYDGKPIEVKVYKTQINKDAGRQTIEPHRNIRMTAYGCTWVRGARY